jgi:hypothetical protein
MAFHTRTRDMRGQASRLRSPGRRAFFFGDRDDRVDLLDQEIGDVAEWEDAGAFDGERGFARKVEIDLIARKAATQSSIDTFPADLSGRAQRPIGDRPAPG